jgi:ABC-type polysaccharide/polyol phosphate transport system ATPase subunit
VPSQVRRLRSSDSAIEFRNVSRRFVLRNEQRTSFQDWFIGLIRPRGHGEEFWALRDVSFSVRHGEAVGILGRNGAGKSTLLKLVTRVLEPTSGDIVTNGRIHAMLELGAGFHPELSGRDNVFLNGSLYGFSRREMEQRFEDVVRFADLERFINTPVKHYSSGMFMRLGFAIAVHMEPEILVIDEVLAVGDAAFQRKGYEALERLKETGTTILFVSHNAEQVRTFCERSVLLEGGQMIDIGPTNEVVDHYQRMLQEVTVDASILRVRPVDQTGAVIERLYSGDDLGVEVLLRLPSEQRATGLFVALDLYDRQGVHLFGRTSQLPDILPVIEGVGSDTRRIRSTLRGLPLAEGPVTVAVTLQRAAGSGTETVDRQETSIEIDRLSLSGSRGMLTLDNAWDWEAPADYDEEPSVGIRLSRWTGR